MKIVTGMFPYITLEPLLNNWILVTPVTLFDCANKLDQKLFMQFFQASMVLKVLYTAAVCHMCPQMCVTGVTVCFPPGTLNTIN